VHNDTRTYDKVLAGITMANTAAGTMMASITAGTMMVSITAGTTMAATAIAGHNKHGTTSIASISICLSKLRNHYAKKRITEDKFYYCTRVARPALAGSGALLSSIRATFGGSGGSGGSASSATLLRFRLAMEAKPARQRKVYC
jgi:hypothetical protein